MRTIGLLLGVIMLTCSKPSLSNVIMDKIDLFDKYENIYFKNISITPLSREPNQRNPKEFEIRKKGKPSFAVIQTMPEIRILKNYYSDTLSIDFVKVFSELDLTRLHNYDKSQTDTLFETPITHLEFCFGKEGIVLFMNKPYLSKDEVRKIFENSIPIDNKWRLFRFPLMPQ